MSKALVLLSGGLDSMLAVKVLQEQGVEVVGISFKSYFFNTESARKAAEQLGIKLIEVDFSEEHLAMVKNPKYGYGKNINPCIDCHAMMIKRAGGTEGYDFIATGEVLGQRPKSQNKETLDIVAKYSGVGDLLVRPLSAKLLDATKPEKEGKIIREKLLDIKGRARQRQMELAKKYGIKEYPSSAGGCLLTDPEFSQRLMKLFECWPGCDGNDVEMIKNGRVFWLSAENMRKALIVVGRNKEECENLEKLAKKEDTVVELKEKMGPLTVVRIFNFQFFPPQRDPAKAVAIFKKEIELEIPKELDMSELKLGEEKSEEEIIKVAGLLSGYYAPRARSKRVKLKIKDIN